MTLEASEAAIAQSQREEAERREKYGPHYTYAVETRSNTYFMTARTAREAREMMTDRGGGFDHDGITDRRIISIQRQGRREIRLTPDQQQEV